jgi:Protein of unknown function (DUF3558)
MLLAVAACGGASPSTSGPLAPTPPPTFTVPIETLGPPPSGTPSPLPTIADLPDPCHLLSASEVSSALGVLFGAGVSSSDADYRYCTFHSTGSYQATFALYLPFAVEDAVDFFDPSATIEPGVGSGSQFAVKELSSPRPGADFGFFALAGDVGVAMEYSVFGSSSSATPAHSTAPATPTPDPSAVGVSIKAALARLAASVVSRLGPR